ncbi:MAG: uroporphyrinogen decarboxylase family protein [Planctomycetota bacterium]
MTPRERFLETIRFGKPDRIPLEPGGGRKSTRARWHKEGLPAHLEDPDEINSYAYCQAGGSMEFCRNYADFPVDERMIPHFEEKVIEKKQTSQIVQDWKGNICEISNEFGVEYLRSAIDFVTRRWIKCPVENRDDWEEMKHRYDCNSPERFMVNAEEAGREASGGDLVVQLNFSGPFWQVREWVGFENLCMMLHDDPEFVKDMIFFWREYISSLLEKAFSYVGPQVVHFSEDMAYKGFSMISPAMIREFLLPCYVQWGEIIKGAGVPIYGIDSDGFIGQIIPLWIEAGVNECDPVEVAAGNDIVRLRQEFGKKMAFRGGIDKRAIAAGGETIVEEIKRNEPIIRDGGFIPSCDHGVPSDISWPDYVRYIKLLAEATGWL